MPQKTLLDTFLSTPPPRVSQEVKTESKSKNNGFRKLRLECTETAITLYIGSEYLCIVTNDHSADMCTCPAITKGGTRKSYFMQPGDPRACEHLAAMWRLAWGREGPTDRKTFREIMGYLQQGRSRQAMINFTVEMARKRMSAEYLIKGQRYFTMDIVHDIQADTPNQRWKAAVSIALKKEGFWIDTRKSANSKVKGNHSQRITLWRLSDVTIQRLETRAGS